PSLPSAAPHSRASPPLLSAVPSTPTCRSRRPHSPPALPPLHHYLPLLLPLSSIPPLSTPPLALALCILPTLLPASLLFLLPPPIPLLLSLSACTSAVLPGNPDPEEHTSPLLSEFLECRSPSPGCAPGIALHASRSPLPACSDTQPTDSTKGLIPHTSGADRRNSALPHPAF